MFTVDHLASTIFAAATALMPSPRAPLEDKFSATATMEDNRISDSISG